MGQPGMKIDRQPSGWQKWNQDGGRPVNRLTMERFNELPRGHKKILCPSNVEAAITGALCAEQLRSGLIRLTYSDGATEERKSDKDVEEFDSWFGVVSHVQEGRTNG